jgi:hypothetical protein
MEISNLILVLWLAFWWLVGLVCLFVPPSRKAKLK